MADTYAGSHALPGRTSPLALTVAVSVAATSGQRDITVTVTDSRGLPPPESVPVTVIAALGIPVGSLVASVVVGFFDIWTTGGDSGSANSAVVVHGRTNASGVITVRLSLALLTLVGTVTGRSGSAVGTVAGS